MFLIIVGFQIRAMERVDREEVPTFEPEIPTNLYLRPLMYFISEPPSATQILPRKNENGDESAVGIFHKAQ